MNTDKIDEATLALMYLVAFQERGGPYRAWKGFDFDTLKRLHDQGLIADYPLNKNKSVMLSEEGYQRAKELFEQMFVDEDEPASGRLF